MTGKKGGMNVKPLSERFRNLIAAVKAEKKQEYNELITDLRNAEVEEFMAVKDRAKVRCPRCGGFVNQLWLNTQYENSGESYIRFIAECWTPGTNRHHYFAVAFKSGGIVAKETETELPT